MRNLLVKFTHKFVRFKSLIVVIPIALIVVSLLKSLEKIKEANLEVKKSEEKLNKVAGENKDLETKLKEAKGNTYIEKQLRDKLGYSKEGEIVVVLPDEDILRKIAPEEKTEEEVLPDPTWKKWMKAFDL